MTKPQTLAEQIRAMEPPRGFGPASIMREGWNAAIIAAAALADAAATTTPVVGAAQACGVRQAVPEWGTSDKTQHYAAMVADTNDADILRAAISDLCRDNERLAVMLKSAKQPDPTPALGWRAMQTAAAEKIENAEPTHIGEVPMIDQERIYRAILSMTGPTDEQALAAAVKLPQWQAMREALEWYGEQARLCRLIHSEGDAGRNALAHDGGKKAAAALAKIGGAA